VRDRGNCFKRIGFCSAFRTEAEKKDGLKRSASGKGRRVDLEGRRPKDLILRNFRGEGRGTRIKLTEMPAEVEESTFCGKKSQGFYGVRRRDYTWDGEWTGELSKIIKGRIEYSSVQK